MSWTTPRTYVTGELVTAAILNTDVRDNLNSLDTLLGATVVHSAMDETGPTTVTGTSFATDSPSVSVSLTTNTSVFLIASCNTSVPSGQIVTMSYAVSGATTVAAADSRGSAAGSIDSGDTANLFIARVITGLTAGVNVFTLQFKVSGGTAFPDKRRLYVIAFR